MVEMLSITAYKATDKLKRESLEKNKTRRTHGKALASKAKVP